MTGAIRLIVTAAVLAGIALPAAAAAQAARAGHGEALYVIDHHGRRPTATQLVLYEALDRKSTRLNSSH